MLYVTDQHGTAIAVHVQHASDEGCQAVANLEELPVERLSDERRFYPSPYLHDDEAREVENGQTDKKG
jgi:hypothetical protein